MRLRDLLIPVLLLTPFPAFAEQAPQTIFANGEGLVTAHPDMATLDIGVVSRAATAAEALRTDSAKMHAVVAAIRALVPDTNDVQTSQFTIAATHPLWRNGAPDYSIVNGYEVTNKVTIAVRDLAKVASVIDAAVIAGANSSNAVTFSVKDYARYSDLAQAEAVRAARHRAEIMAGAEHATVGAVISMSTMPAGYAGNGLYGASPIEATALSGPDAPILPGTITIVGQAYVTFVLK